MGNRFQQLRVLAGGIPIPLKNMSLPFASWDDDIPDMESQNSHVPNNQPG